MWVTGGLSNLGKMENPMHIGKAVAAPTLRNYTDRGFEDQAEAARALAAGIMPAHASIPPDTGHVGCAGNQRKVLDSSESIRQHQSATYPMPHQTMRSPGTTELPRNGDVAVNQRGSSVPRDLKLPVRRGEKARMSKWAILDSNQYPAAPDMPPRLAGVIHHALRVAERWSDHHERPGSSEPFDDQGNTSGVPGRSA